MTIHELKAEIKSTVERLNSREVYTIVLIILVGFASFGLGRLSKLQESPVPIRIEQAVLASPQTASALSSSPPVSSSPRGDAESLRQRSSGGGEVRGGGSPEPLLVSSPLKGEEEKRIVAGGQIVASKNGTKYHFPWCSGAQRISEANKVWFISVEEARKAGYTPASNCKGLK